MTECKRFVKKTARRSKRRREISCVSVLILKIRRFCSVGLRIMKNKQFYRIRLTDYARLGFSSGWKDYYGTQEEIEELIIAIRNNKSIGNDVDGLYAVLTEFKSGNKTCEHSIVYGRSRFLTPVRLIGKSEHYEKSYKWKHVNIWHYPYYMRAKVAMFRQIIIKDGKDYIRAIKPEFEFLEYALDEAFRYSDKVGVMFWGFPEMIRYNDDTKTTSSRLYVFEKRYTDKLSACADLNMKDKIELQSFCNEIFGDG